LCGEFWPLPSTNAAKTAASLVAATELDACWNGRFHHTMEQVLNQRWEWEKQDIFRAIGGYRDDGYRLASQVVNFTASHDEVRPEHEIKYYSWQNMQRPAGMGVPELALRKAKLGLVTLFAAPGVPMIYAGQEFGEDAPRTIDFCPINWDRLDRISHHRHFELVQRLIAARRRSPALRGDHILFAENDFARDHVVRWRRTDPGGDTALAAVNFGETVRQVVLEIPNAGDWHEIVSDHVQHLAEGPATFTLEPWQSVLLVSV